MTDGSRLDSGAVEPDEPVTLDAAVRLGKQGRPPKGSHDNVLDIGRGGEYVAARLERDGFPDEAKAVREGLKSARQAAYDHGWRKPPEPLVERTLRAVARMTDPELYAYRLIEASAVVSNWSHELPPPERVNGHRYKPLDSREPYDWSLRQRSVNEFTTVNFRPPLRGAP